MDNSGQHEPPALNGTYLQPPYTPNRAPAPAAHEPTHADFSVPRWTPCQGYDAQSYGPWCNPTVPSPGVESVGEHRPPVLYGYPPNAPPFSFPPPGHVSGTVPSVSLNAYDQRGAAAFQAFDQQFRYNPRPTQYQLNNQTQQQHEYQDFNVSRYPPSCPPNFQQVENHDQRPRATVSAENEETLQKRQDQQWIRNFLRNRKQPSKTLQTQQPNSVPELRQTLYGAVQLVSQLKESCDKLRSNTDNDSVWLDSHVIASRLKGELESKLKILESLNLDGRNSTLSRAAKRRARRLRAVKLQEMDERQREQRLLEKEAAIDRWRQQKIRQVEDKKKEQELKLAADAVLCEVRKKQSDVKRMQDVLRSLEKLRKLRKEAASRKGIVTEQECEEAFSSRLDKLRHVLKSRTTVYSSEEKALMVMLEGEQEEERRREREKQVKNEREKWLQRKQSVDAMLFGDEFPTNSILQAFHDYYTQAQHSLHALLQIRREWDVFVAEAAHPEGSPVPQSWILPEVPSDHVWASALHEVRPPSAQYT